MRGLELRVPPPLAALAWMAGMWAFARAGALALPESAAGWPFVVRVGLATALSGAGGLLALAGALAFRRNRTTIDPVHPGRATTLVTSGPYALSRNPMYVGLLAVLLAWALKLDSWPALAGPPAFGLYLRRFQIDPEERALAARFGPAFAAYAARVRRWL